MVSSSGEGGGGGEAGGRFGGAGGGGGGPPSPRSTASISSIKLGPKSNGCNINTQWQIHRRFVSFALIDYTLLVVLPVLCTSIN